MLKLIRKGDACGVSEIIIIRDSVLDKKRKKYTKVTIPYDGNIMDVGKIISMDVHEEYYDISELIMNQIVSSAMRDVSMKNIYIMVSNALYGSNKTYSSKIIRYFVRKRKENGDVFLFVGSNKISQLIAKIWGFKQVSFLQNVKRE